MKKTGLLLSLALMAILTGCGEATSLTSQTGSSIGTSTSTSVAAIKVKIDGDGTVKAGKSTTLEVTVYRDSTKAGFDIKMTDETIATCTLNEDGTVLISGLKVGKTTFTATSKADKTISDTLEINVIADISLKLTVSADKTEVNQNGTIALNVTIADYTDPITYTWTSLYQKGTFSGQTESNSVTYTAGNYGSDIIEASVKVGTDVYKDTINVFIKADYTDWTRLSTAQEVKDNLLKEGQITGNYYLANDIDLENYSIVYNGNSFAGSLDGQGYSIKNYQVGGKAEDKSNGGFFSSIEAGSFVSDIGFEGVSIGEDGSGWGTSAICCACSGNLENVFTSVTHTFDNSTLINEEEWFPFNSALVGVFKEGSTYRNIVVNVNKEPDGGYKTIFADVAYPAGGKDGLQAQGTQTFSVVDFYTNSDVIGGSVWDWGSPVEDLTGYHTAIDWATSKEADYANLDSQVFDIKAGEMPVLKDQA